MEQTPCFSAEGDWIWRLSRHDKGVDVTETITEKHIIDNIIKYSKVKRCWRFWGRECGCRASESMIKPSINLWSRHQVLVQKKLCRLICSRMYLLCQGCLVSSKLIFECQSRDCQRQLHGSTKETLLYIVLFAVFFKYVLLFRCVLMLLKSACYLCRDCLSIHLSGCPRVSALLPLRGVVWNLILETLSEYTEKIQIWLKLDINVTHDIRRPEHICIVDTSVKYFVAQQWCE